MSTATETITNEHLCISQKMSNQDTILANDMSTTATFSNLIRPDLHDYSRASNLAFNEKVKKLMAEGKAIHHFGFGQTPFPVDDHFKEALSEYAGAMEYLPVSGLPALKEEIVKFHERYDTLTFHSDQVIVGPGTKELILLMMTVYNGDVMLLAPSWTTYSPQAKLSRHKSYIISTSQENKWRLTPQLIEDTIQRHNLRGNKVLIFCNPCNPTGTAYTKSQLQALSTTLRKHNIIVISDEIYARLHYTQEHQSLAKYYPEGTILSSGMSKWASAGGWRLGYHIYPPQLKTLQSAVISAGSHSFSCAPAPQQYAVAKALRNGEACHSYILHTSRIMSEVGKFCTRELKEEGVIVTPPYAGYYIFPNFEILQSALKERGITTGRQMCDAIFDEASVALLPGGPEHLRPVDEFTTRLCYVCFDGTEALQKSRQIGLDKPLPDDFVLKYCTPVYDGIKAIRSWMKKQLKS